MIYGSENGKRFVSQLGYKIEVGKTLHMGEICDDWRKPIYFCPLYRVTELANIEHSLHNGAYKYVEHRVYYQ